MDKNCDEKNGNYFGKRKREHTTTTTTTTIPTTTTSTTNTTTTSSTGTVTDHIIGTDDEPPKKRICSPPSTLTLTSTSQTMTTTTTTSLTSSTKTLITTTSKMVTTEGSSLSSSASSFTSTNASTNNECNDPSNGISQKLTTTGGYNDDNNVDDDGGDDGGGGSSLLYQYYHQRYRRHENPNSFNLKNSSNNNDNNNNNNNSNNEKNNKPNHNNNNNNNSNEKLQIKVNSLRSSALSTSSSSLPSSPEPECFDDVDLTDSTNDLVQNCDRTTTHTTTTTQTTPTTRRATMASTVIAPNDIRVCPLPPLSWAESTEVWNLMIKKDERAAIERSSSMFNNHKAIAPRMRAILLDWLIEVCEVYKLHRETYYLAIDYLDRYLTLSMNIPKGRLQLIGITCLFVAAKVEEIYPPKIGEFAYVTDGACKEEDIIQEERILLNVLQWHITPVTIMGWLSVYMQVNVSNRMPSVMTRSMTAAAATATSTLCASPTRVNDYFLNNPSSSTTFINNKTPIKMKTRQQTLTSYLTTSSSTTNSPSPSSSSSSTLSAINKHFLTPPSIKKSIKHKVPDVINKYDESFVYPQFSGLEFCQTAQLIDLCSLDHEIANYQYSVIAAAAISHTLNRETSMNVSGLDWDVIDGCAKWMLPYYLTICDEISPMPLLEQNEPSRATYGLSHISKNLNTNELHVLQTHSTTLDMFDKAGDRMYNMIVAGMSTQNETPSVKPSAEEVTSPTTTTPLESTPLIHGKIIDKTYLTGLLTPPTSNGKPSSEDTNSLML